MNKPVTKSVTGLFSDGGWLERSYNCNEMVIILFLLRL